MAFNGTGSNVTSLNASNIASGTVATARLGSGTPSSSNFLRGDGTWASAGGGPNPLHGSQVFTSSGTFTAPTGVTAIKVQVIAAGGSGATGSNSVGAGGGGGAGGYIVDYLTISAGGTASVTVGTNGGSRTSSFAVSGGSTLTASGGNNGGGPVSLCSGNTGYQGTSGAATMFGQTYYQVGPSRGTGGAGPGMSGVTSSANTVQRNGGAVYGHGLGTSGGGANEGTQSALGYGGGGSGGVIGAISAGSGGNGIVIVEW